MTTTIQISNEVKDELLTLKKEKTYDDVLKQLLKKNKKYLVAEEMREYGTKYSKENLEEVKEWETTETQWN
jgi:predicted CopG family antitoxin